MPVVLAVLLGLLLGGLGGFVAALAQGFAKQSRNARLVRVGQPARRNAIRLRWHLPCALVGALASGALSFGGWPLTEAALLGAVSLPAMLVLVFVLGALWARLRP